MSDNIKAFIQSAVAEKPVAAYNSIDKELQKRVEDRFEDLESEFRSSLFADTSNEE